MTRGERIVAIFAPVSLIAIWQIAVSTKLLNPGLFPSPAAIAANFVAYAASGELATNTAWTLGRLIVGCLIGGVPGTLVGLAMGMNRWVRAYFVPVIALLYPIPKIAANKRSGRRSRWACFS